ncbi:MAG TPA: hypothetical protein VHH36_04520, partial [Candidatus Thermoplasmatota archaeon]|nr:hypothetical protein [Candidatus Thermoplasmatota archaeon]
MTHCTACGGAVQEGWRHCAACGAPLGSGSGPRVLLDEVIYRCESCGREEPYGKLLKCRSCHDRTCAECTKVCGSCQEAMCPRCTLECE